MPGTLIISLDFELFWGVRDHATLEQYGANVRGERQAIPAILALFKQYEIRATWATVGFLFFKSKADLLRHLPNKKPSYVNPKLSPYDALAQIGEDEAADPYYFGRALLDQIRAVEGQEIGSHTFSHYYALERGQTLETFRHDMRAALDAGARLGIDIRSLVFPRNQCNAGYIRCCRELGLTSYRGNQRSWLYRERAASQETRLKRGARLLDAYINMSGHHTYLLEDVARAGVPFNLPASRFLRPWSNRLRALEERRLQRIESAMTFAARQGEAFHLWWHPHNFGTNLDKNLGILARLLNHFRLLRSSYRMQSSAMGDVAASLPGREQSAASSGSLA
jgi:peptidoglycan/xylan/chitin deacetylase (PgdA/CDA1 family)